MGGSAKTCQKYKKLKVKYKKNIKHSTPPMQNIKPLSGDVQKGPKSRVTENLKNCPPRRIWRDDFQGFLPMPHAFYIF